MTVRNGADQGAYMLTYVLQQVLYYISFVVNLNMKVLNMKCCGGMPSSQLMEQAVTTQMHPTTQVRIISMRLHDPKYHEYVLHQSF